MAKARLETAGTSAPASAPQASRSEGSSSEAAQSAAPFAVASDGAIFMNVGTLDSIDTSALEGCTLFIGVELVGSERRQARKVLDDAGHDLRAKIAPARRRVTKPRPKGEKVRGTRE